MFLETQLHTWTWDPSITLYLNNKVQVFFLACGPQLSFSLFLLEEKCDHCTRPSVPHNAVKKHNFFRPFLCVKHVYLLGDE